MTTRESRLHNLVDTTSRRGSTCSKKPTQELIDRHSQESLLVFMSGISPAKRNPVIPERDETAIGDRHAMRVGAEVAKHLLGSAESWFAIDHPAVAEELAEKTMEDFGLRQRLELSVELKLPRREGLLPGGWRDQEVWPERKYATWRRGERMPSQKPNSLLPCPCGQVFDSHRLEETVVHVPHITALAAVH